MSALDLFSVDWLYGVVRDYCAARRPACVVVYGTEQDWQFQAKEEERIVVGVATKHGLGPPGPQGAPGPETVAHGQRVTSFMTLGQGAWIAIRAICVASTPDATRVLESQRRVFQILRVVLNAIDSAPEAHGSTNLVLGVEAELFSPETADYQHGALLLLPLKINVPVYGEPRGTVAIVEASPAVGQTRTTMTLAACDADDVCQVVIETT